MKNLTCPICRRNAYMTRDGVARHLAVDHSRRAVADQLVAAVLPELEPDPPAAPRRTPCGKKRYPTREAAFDVLIKAALSKSPNRAETRAYECERCSAWHLTKQKETPCSSKP